MKFDCETYHLLYMVQTSIVTIVHCTCYFTLYESDLLCWLPW